MKEWLETVTVIGVDDLDKSVKKMVNRYPDKAGECLREEARRTRKEIVKNARDDLNTNSENRVSLGRIGTYKISQVIGYDMNQRVEISARAPHYHLVERGHAMKLPYHFTYRNKKTGKVIAKRTWKNGGQSRGRVNGVFFLKKAKEAEAERFPEFVSSMLDSLIKDAGF